MRRKLINWDAFDRIQKDSLSAAEHELLEASDLLAEVLGVDHLQLSTYGESNVLYETLDGTYVRADYEIAKEHLTFENIEELVIDDETAAAASRKQIADMVDAILVNENEKAGQMLGEYMGSPLVRRMLTEGRPKNFVADPAERKKAGITRSKNASKLRLKQQKRKLDAAGPAHHKPRRKRGTFGSAKNDPNYMKRYGRLIGKKLPRNIINAKGNVEKKKCMKEWHALSEHVIDFVSFKENGPVLKESVVKRDDKGNVIAIRVPNVRLRNENRLLSLNHQHMLDTDVKVVREEAHFLSKDPNFCKAVADLKRHNNMSDNDGLQETLNAIIGRFPAVLYLSQTELAHAVAESLHTAGVTNYDDETCTFMAEGILRTAHEVYGDKVEKILRLAGAEVAENEDPYVHFQGVVHTFFPTLDENFSTELRVFNDLFSAVNEVWEVASQAGDAAIAEDAESILGELSAVVNGESDVDLVLAADVAEWLQHYAESNLEGGEWTVSNTPHQTISGDHPAMAEKARKSYSPSQDFGADAGAWQNRATEKQFTGPQWTSVGGEKVYPGLNNPYVPEPLGDYTMSGEKGVDKDWRSGEGTWQSSDTWPNLQNPYVPKAETPKSYKMKNGSETKLVVDV